MLAAPAWHFVCYTEAVAERKEPVETDGKKPELREPEPLQAVMAQEPNPAENGSNQPRPGGVGVKEQAESTNSTVKEEKPCSPPPPGKYLFKYTTVSYLLVHVSTPLAKQMSKNK